MKCSDTLNFVCKQPAITTLIPKTTQAPSTTTKTTTTTANPNPKWNDQITEVTPECLMEFRRSMLERHNYYRSIHGVQPLKYDEGLNNATQKSAKFTGDSWTATLQYDYKLISGENFYRSWWGASWETCYISLKFCRGKK